MDGGTEINTDVNRINLQLHIISGKSLFSLFNELMFVMSMGICQGGVSDFNRDSCDEQG